MALSFLAPPLEELYRSNSIWLANYLAIWLSGADICSGSLSLTLGSLYLAQFNSDLYETLNLSSWGTNYLSQLVKSTWATPK